MSNDKGSGLFYMDEDFDDTADDSHMSYIRELMYMIASTWTKMLIMVGNGQVLVLKVVVVVVVVVVVGGGGGGGGDDKIRKWL